MTLNLWPPGTMHNAQVAPARTRPLTPARLELHMRAARTYVIATADLDRTPNTFRKARAISQGPSQFERVMEQMVMLRTLGVTTTALRAFAIELNALCHELDTTSGEELKRRVESMCRQAQEVENAGNTAEVDAMILNLGSPRELRQLGEAYEAEARVKTEAASVLFERAREIEARADARVGVLS